MYNFIQYFLTAWVVVLTVVAITAPTEQAVHAIFAVLSVGVLQLLLSKVVVGYEFSQMNKQNV